MIYKSEFSHIQSPGSFGKEKRKIFFDVPLSPGPAAHYKEKRVKSPGGAITKQKRVIPFENKEREDLPGPMEYQPLYHFISKSKM